MSTSRAETFNFGLSLWQFTASVHYSTPATYGLRGVVMYLRLSLKSCVQTWGHFFCSHWKRFWFNMYFNMFFFFSVCVSVITNRTLTKPVRAVRGPFKSCRNWSSRNSKKKQTKLSGVWCESVCHKDLPPPPVWQRYSEGATPVVRRTDKGSNRTVQHHKWSQQQKCQCHSEK